MKRWIKIFLSVLILFFVTTEGQAQGHKHLEKKKKKIRKEINQMNDLLKEISINKKNSTLASLITQMKIGAREDLIKSINDEIYWLEQDIVQQQEAIDSLHDQLANYRSQYEKMLQYAYKNRNATNSLVFVFSSSDFNEAYKRLKYLKKISEYREHQAVEIAEAQKEIEREIVKIEAKKERKKRFLGDKYYEKKKLQVEKKENQEAITNLKKDEKALKKKILAKQKAAKKLDNQIRIIIQKELEAARLAAKRAREAAKKGEKRPANDLTQVSDKLSKNFAGNKGKLPWPATGVYSGMFGISKHHALKHIKVNNNGVNILTKRGTDAKAVFKGTVVAVIVIPSGAKSAVLLQHGAYFTLYSNLSVVKVKKGQKVKIGQSLGTIKTDEEESKTEIHFELWKGNVKQNPALWLKKK